MMACALRPDAGPPAPLSSRPNTGLWPGVAVLRYEVGAGESRLQIEGAGDHFEVALYPSRTDPVRDDSDVRLAITIHTANGEEWLRDQYGTVFDGTASTLMAEQWNLLTVAADDLPARAIAISLSSCHPHANGWVQARHRDVEPLPSDVLEQVDMTRGSHSSFAHSRGNTAPAAAAPHGMFHVGPITDPADAGWPYRWHDTQVAGIAATTRPSPWLGGPAWVQLLFADGDGKPAPIPLDHEQEQARTHRYRLGAVELTATERTGALRVPEGTSLLVRAPEGETAITSDGGRVRLRIRSVRPGVPGRRPVVGHVLVEANATVSDQGDMVALTDLTGVVRLSFSYLSDEQAERTLDEENRPHAFDVLVRANEQRWRDILGRFELVGATPQQQRAAATMFARLYLWPSIAYENTGTAEQSHWKHADLYGADTGEVAVLDGPLYVNNGYWDTYRTCWPAYALFTPERAAHLLEGIRAQYCDGGWMARWAAPGYTDCMVGTSSDVVFADAAAYGIDGWDEVSAYDSALRNATVPSDEAAVGRRGLAQSRFRGWVSNDIPEGLSWSLEGALCDDVMARWATDLAGRAAAVGYPERAQQWRAEARYFGHRALAVRGLFDSETGFFQGRDAQGRPTYAPADFDPARWGGDYAETNAWGTSASTVHDGPGLRAAYGGAEGLAAHLDRLHHEPETAAESMRGTYPGVIHEMTEARALRTGMSALSNQPAHHLPFMELHAGRPWRTQELTREYLDRLFCGAEIGQGYPGDEDNGEMSAWWLFAAFGLYPLLPGSGEYVLTAPLLEQMRFTRADGTVLDVRTKRPDGFTQGQAQYIAAVRVNGQQWDRVSIPVQVLRGNCRIDVDLVPEPTSWGADSWPAGPAQEFGVGWLADASARALVQPESMRELVDDRGEQAMAWSAGTDLVLTWPEPIDIDHLTLTLDAPATFEVAVCRAGEWTQLPPLTLQPRWPNQTVPVLLEEGQHRESIRLRPGTDVSVRQVEVFADRRISLIDAPG